MTISNVDMADYVLNVGQLGMMQHIVMCKGLEGLPVNSVNGVDNGLREGHEHATLHHILSSPCPVVSYLDIERSWWERHQQTSMVAWFPYEMSVMGLKWSDV